MEKGGQKRKAVREIKREWETERDGGKQRATCAILHTHERADRHTDQRGGTKRAK